MNSHAVNVFDHPGIKFSTYTHYNICLIVVYFLCLYHNYVMVLKKIIISMMRCIESRHTYIGVTPIVFSA